MKEQRRGSYTLKTYNSYLYTWKPETSISHRVNKKKDRFCNAVAYSNGEDWFSTYAYKNVIEGTEQKRLAYFACDYVV